MASHNLAVPGIYCIRNLLTKRVYVGSSQNVRARLKSHRYMLRHGKHHSRILQRSWDRDGADAFEFVLLERVDDATMLLRREQHWIAEMNSCDPRSGFNLCQVAGTRKGVPQPPSVSEKMRAVHLGKPKTAEHRAKISEAAQGRPKSDATRAKLRDATIRQFQSRDAREAAARGAAKLGDDQVRDIRRRYAGGESQGSIARSLGARQSTISLIVNGKTYLYVQ